MNHLQVAKEAEIVEPREIGLDLKKIRDLSDWLQRTQLIRMNASQIVRWITSTNTQTITKSMLKYWHNAMCADKTAHVWSQ